MRTILAAMLVAAVTAWGNVASAVTYLLPTDGTVQIIVPESLTGRITYATVTMELIGAFGPAYNGTCALRPFAGIFCDGTNPSSISVITTINVDPTVRSIPGLGEITYEPILLSQSWGNCSPFRPTCGAFQLWGANPAGVPDDQTQLIILGTATLHITSNLGVRFGEAEFESISLRIELPDGFSIFTPVPAALPLFATGLGALGLLTWRRKRAQRTW